MSQSFNTNTQNKLALCGTPLFPERNVITAVYRSSGGMIHTLCQTPSRQWQTRLYTQFQWYLWLVGIRG